MRRDFAFHDEKRWARLYGVLETTRRRRKNEDADEDGVFTGNRRYRNQAKEQPGISPAIVSRLLDTTIFLSLKDLNLALPAYKEEVVTLEMLDDQGQQYHSMESSLKQLAVQSSRYLSTWLQWSLARPNSAFRDEVVLVDEVEGEDGSAVRKVPLTGAPGNKSERTQVAAKRRLAGQLLQDRKAAGQEGSGLCASDRYPRHSRSRPDAAAVSWTTGGDPGRQH